MNYLKYVSMASISKKHIQLSLHLLYNKHCHNSRQLQYYYAHKFSGDIVARGAKIREAHF